MKRLLLLVIVFLFVVNVAGQDKRKVTITFNKNPFTQDGSRWKTGGDAIWVWNSYGKYLQSGKLLDGNETWLTFTIECGGSVSFVYRTSTEKNCDYMYFEVLNIHDINNKKYKAVNNAYSGRAGWKTDSINLEPGKYTFKWQYSKDRSSYSGEDQVCIKSISYYPVTNKTKIEKVLLQYFDNQGELAWGNDDKIINTFETVKIIAKPKFKTNFDRNNIKVVPILPKGFVLLVSPGYNKDDQSFFFSILASPKYNKDKIEFPIQFLLNGKVLKETSFSAPFSKVDRSKLFLQKEKVLKSQKFNYKSKTELETFLQKYPNSKLAPLIFRLRLECCRRFRDNIFKTIITNKNKKVESELIKAINEYHEFIEKYPDRILTKVAIYECFDLYRRINRISFYDNFIKRYPHSEHSIVAKEHIKFLIYQLVCAQNTVAGYDKFLQLYPSSSIYRTKCINLQIKKSLENEKKIINKLKDRWDRNDRAHELLAEILKIRNEYKQLALKKRLEKIITDNRIQILKTIITNLYSDTFAITTILLLDDLQDIKQLNQKLVKVLKKQHQQTLKAMDDHFTSLQKNLESNFKAVNKQLAEVKKNIKELKDDIKILHQDMNQNFTQLSKNVEKGFNKINKKLDKMDKSIEQNFVKLNTKLDAGFEQINNSFQVLHHDLDEINKSIIKMDANQIRLSKENRQFMKQQAGELVSSITENNRIYGGYGKYRQPTFKSSVSKTVSNALKLGVAYIPVVGPIASKVGAPVLNWMGEKATHATVALWKEIW